MVFRMKHAAVSLMFVVLCTDSAVSAEGVAGLKAVALRCEYLQDPQGIDETKPRLTWRVESNERGQRQTAYQLLVAGGKELLRADQGDLWNSGKVESDQTSFVKYAGKLLRSKMHCWWKVRCWDKDGRVSAWSQPGRWTMGLLDKAAWGGAKWIWSGTDWRARWADYWQPVLGETQRPIAKAHWVCWNGNADSDDSGKPDQRYFRREVRIPADKKITKAIAEMYSDGYFALHVNGQRVVSEGFHQVRAAGISQVDVAENLHPGNNVLAAWVRPGSTNRAVLVGTVRIEFAEGPPLVVATDGTWLASDQGPKGWMEAEFDTSGWAAPKVLGEFGIEPWGNVDGPLAPDPWFRKTFQLDIQPTEALAYIASRGYHELYVNGRKVDDRVLTPNVSHRDKRARYVTYDIVPYLKQGKNAVALWLGSGWRPQAQVIGLLDVGLADGRRVEIATDANWKMHPAYSGLLVRFFGGEYIDARRELPGWNEPQLDDSDWLPAATCEVEVALTAEMTEPNRIVKRLHPVKIEKTGDRKYRFDMGRAFAGYLALKLRGKPGQRFLIKRSEREEQELTFGQRSVYVLGNSGEGAFRNRFTYDAGRWVTVEGLDYAPDLDDAEGCAIRNDYRRASAFECSNELINRIYETVLWTYEGLSLGGYVVDCPHRERLGYGGDAHSSMETAMNNYHVGAFYTKWMQDWRDVQLPEGGLPFTAPQGWGGGGPGWSGICVTLPWEIYLAYGDRGILEENYPMMRRWIALLDEHDDEDNEPNILKPFDIKNPSQPYSGKWGWIGDWLPPGPTSTDTRGRDQRNQDAIYVNACYHLHNLQIIARVADVLGKPDQARAYHEKAAAVAQAIHAKYFDPKSNSYERGGQYELTLPLFLNIVPADRKAAVWKSLEDDILVKKRGHLDTGIHGTYFLQKLLTESDRNDLFYEIASKKTYPGWGFMVESGATTIWETWGYARISLFHHCFLSIGAWPLEGVLGVRIDPENPGYKHFFVKPGVVGDLTWARGHFDSIHGRITCSWKLDGGKFSLNLTVPPNTSATVFVPATTRDKVTEGGKPAADSPGVELLRVEDRAAVYRVRPGAYRFVSHR